MRARKYLSDCYAMTMQIGNATGRDDFDSESKSRVVRQRGMLE